MCQVATMKEWNQRFVFYARAHGLSPVEMLEVDKVRYPGGKMAGFIGWSLGMLGKFYDYNGIVGGELRSRGLMALQGGQARYSKFLEEQTR